jgi:anthranilate 1,2-dioxygenase large subunit
MNAIQRPPVAAVDWPGQQDSATRVPGRVFVDPDIYALEQERIFRGPVWNFVGLEAEIPKPGDYKTVQVADTPVIVSRDTDGSIHAWLNRCAHRNAKICLDKQGNTDSFYCVYHQWAYDLTGRLTAVPFARGIGGQGGMPADFDMDAIRPKKLRVANFCGVLFVSFSDDTPPIDDYLGPHVARFMRRIFHRPIKILGHQHQHMRGNWKLYAENPRDGYHASLLHLFFATFGLFRASQKGQLHVDESGLQTCFYTYVGKEDEAARQQGMKEAAHTYQEGTYTLEDGSLLKGKMEWDDGINLVIIDVFPIMMLQQIANVLNIRQFEPHGPDGVTVHYTFFGYADEEPELTDMRLKQINLIGPAGLVSMEDGLAIEIVQQGIANDGGAEAIIEMGGKTVAPDTTFMASEDPVRGFWNGYRRLMGL